MTRSLQELGSAPTTETRDHRLLRSTARAFAAATSALLISTLVVNRSGDALTIEGTVAETTINSATIALTDDDGGRSLFDLSDMAPNRPVERCIEITYEGSILPVEVNLLVEGSGDLMPFLDLTIEEGEGGGFDSCEGFAPDSLLFRGTLQDLVANGRMDVGVIHNAGEHRTFRIHFELADRQEALGLTTTVDFVWEAEPS